jgi:hypothetical protein
MSNRFSPQFSWVWSHRKVGRAAVFCLVYPDHLRGRRLFTPSRQSRIRNACAHIGPPAAVTLGGADLAILARTDQLEKRLAIGPGYTLISVLSFSRQCAVSRGDRRVCDSLSLPFRTRTSLRHTTNRAPATPVMGVLSDASIANRLCNRMSKGAHANATRSRERGMRACLRSGSVAD